MGVVVGRDEGRGGVRWLGRDEGGVSGCGGWRGMRGGVSGLWLGRDEGRGEWVWWWGGMRGGEG